MKTHKLPGQIMVIVLLLLSVLTIIALTATLTAVRDTKEQVQNKQYEQYYALGESTILDMQRFLGTSALSDKLGTGAPYTTPIPVADGTERTVTCQAITDGYSCNYNNIATGQATTTGSAETFMVYQEIRDTTFIKNYNISKDQDLLINLAATGDNATYLFWTEPEVSWNMSFDYLKTDGTYGTNKAVFNAYSNGVFAGMGAGTISNPECVKLAIIPNTDPIWDTETTKLGIKTSNPYMLKLSYLSNIATCPNLSKELYFRIRALRNADSTLTISLDKVGNTIPLQRTLTNMTTTNNSGNTQNPTVVQEGSYLLVSTPLSLFDYVLRTEQGITK